MGFQRPEGGWRFNFAGMKTNTAADEMPPTKYPYAKNVRYVKSLQTRPGYVKIFDTNPPPAGCSSLLWSVETASPLTTWHDVVYAPELTLFVACGNITSTNYVITSPDGITWTAHNLGVLGYTQGSICWSPALLRFVTVSQDTHVATSPDGVTWTQRTASSAVAWTSVCWSETLNLFCAVSNDESPGVVMTSPDGITWTTRTTPTTIQDWNDVIWVAALNLFIACGTDFTGAFHDIMTSPDGITWTLRTVPSNDNQWAGLAYSPTLGLVVAVGQTGSGADNRTMHSTDGITWVLGTVPAAGSGNGLYTGITWSPALALFTATGFDDGTGSFTGVLSHSSDGVIFTLDTKPVSGHWNAIAGAGSILVVVGDNTNVAATHGQLRAICASA